jgi:RimJ/RimL family protein N-acetyltransferase
MFDIDIQFEDISITSIKSGDIMSVQKWLNLQQFYCNRSEEPVGFEEFYERFLEYYISEGEFFLKINKSDELIGLLKGRLEFKNPNEVWLGFFIVGHDHRGKGLGSEIIRKVSDYFFSSFGIDIFYTGVADNDVRLAKFWKKNNFELLRVSKNYFNINGRERDMLVFKKGKYK